MAVRLTPDDERAWSYLGYAYAKKGEVGAGGGRVSPRRPGRARARARARGEGAAPADAPVVSRSVGIASADRWRWPRRCRRCARLSRPKRAPPELDRSPGAHARRGELAPPRPRRPRHTVRPRGSRAHRRPSSAASRSNRCRCCRSCWPGSGRRCRRPSRPARSGCRSPMRPTSRADAMLAGCRHPRWEPGVSGASQGRRSTERAARGRAAVFSGLTGGASLDCGRRPTRWLPLRAGRRRALRRARIAWWRSRARCRGRQARCRARSCACCSSAAAARWRSSWRDVADRHQSDRRKADAAAGGAPRRLGRAPGAPRRAGSGAETRTAPVPVALPGRGRASCSRRLSWLLTDDFVVSLTTLRAS